MTLYSKIIGTGSYLPPKCVTNDALARHLASRGIETSDEWIVSRSGISARHYAEKHILSSDLAVSASLQALEMAELQANDLDLIIMATSTPDYLGGFPSTACILQRKLCIINNAPAMDIQAVCSGFIYAMSVADNFIKSGTHKNVLVVGAEVFSRILNFEDRTTCVLFGDGAGAIIMTASITPGILASRLHADGIYSDILCIPGHINSGILTGSPYLHMDGPVVFKLAVLVLDKVAREVLQIAGIDATEIDWLIPHQANLRIMHSIAKKLELPLEKMIITVDKHGNTSAASIPLALDQAIRDGRIKSGHCVLMEGAGGGLTWGAILVKA